MADNNITTYKSQFNKDREVAKLHSHCTNVVTVSIEPNISLNLRVDFKTEYAAIPFFNYMFVCNDNEFGLQHYIKEITTKTATLCILNLVDLKRNITIQYKTEGVVKLPEKLPEK